MRYNFSGRPDGLGNRLEQIIMLEAICLKKNMTINYVWNNLYSYRTYDILFATNLVDVTKTEICDLPFRWEGIDPERLDLYKGLNQKEVLDAAKLIKPKFKIHFETTERPVGIHIRGTDRIGMDHSHFMKDYEEFNRFISKTIRLINDLKPKYVYICSDNSGYKKILKKYLDKKIIVTDPVCNSNVPEEYIDLFALSMCETIYMCSKFSTFSIISSLIGNIPIVSYVYDENIKERYKAQFIYNLGLDSQKQKNYVIHPDKTRKVIFNRFVFRLKVILVKFSKFFLSNSMYYFLKEKIK